MSYPVPPVEVSALIPAPPADVIDFVADTRNDPLWCDNVESVEMLTLEPVGVGSKFRFHQHLDQPGRARVQFDVDVETTHRDDNSVAWRVSDRFQEREITVTVAPSGTGSRITQRTVAVFNRPPGIARWLYPIMARRIFKRQFRALAERLTTGTM